MNRRIMFYEGDVILVKIPLNEEATDLYALYGEVVFKDQAFGVISSDTKDFIPFFIMHKMNKSSNYDIIISYLGNIYEKPDILTASQIV